MDMMWRSEDHLGTYPSLLPCSRHACTRWAGPPTSRDAHVSASYFAVGAWVCRSMILWAALLWVLGIQTQGLHVYTSALYTEPSLQSLNCCKHVTQWHKVQSDYHIATTPHPTAFPLDQSATEPVSNSFLLGSALVSGGLSCGLEGNCAAYAPL